MVNIEEFANRLKLVMDYYEISAALFAEKIEVQRSSISHILSGRNKPSLEFVLKIVENFPEVELYWLLNGVGKFPNKIENKPTNPTLFSESSSEEISKTSTKSKKNSDTDSAIEQIVIFYKDGSFKNYTP
ncbi:MAG: transcriptional regulator [Lutibacter sp.]|nr:MAG: transcriptional regulator [Lutibacter sp.]